MSAARPPRGSVERSLSQYLSREVYPHAEAARQRLDDARVGSAGLRTAGAFTAVAPMTLDDAADGRGYLLQPTRDAVLRNGSPAAAARMAWAGLWGRWPRYVQRTLEPRYRPVHFFDAKGVPVGASQRDLVRLSGLATRWLDALGVTRDDALVLVGGAAGGVEAWELSAGTRRRGVALATLDEPGHAAPMRPTVVAGPPEAVDAALAGGPWPELRLLVVFGRTPIGDSAGVAVRRAWAPPGVRAAWYECLRGGVAGGWHSNPGAEFVEVDSDDEVLWTALGWSGTVFLRLRTDVRARLDSGVCPACGHPGPRLVELAGSPTLARFLAGDPRVAEFRLTLDGADVLPVRAGANARLKADAAAVVPGAELRIVGRRGWKEAAG